MTALTYSVIKFVPDPVADESVNIGVVVFDPSGPKCQFVSNWQRARRFAGGDIHFLREFADEFSKLQLPLDLHGAILEADQLQRNVLRWKNAIQFTPPRPSLKAPDALLAEIASTFLHDPPESEGKITKGRPYAARFAADIVRSAAFDRFGSGVRHLVKQRTPLQGKRSEHNFDVVLANGSPYVGAFGLSFNVPATASLRKEVDAAAFAIDDVRRSHPKLPLGIVLVGGRSNSAHYSRAKELLQDVGADVVTPSTARNWATDIVQSLPANLLKHGT